MATLEASESIAVRGAAEGGLESVDLDIPLGKLICFTGRPGSGSRAMTLRVLYAESQRRYMLALAPWEREYLGGVGSVAVESIEALPPAMFLDRREKRRRENLAAFLQIDDLLGQLLQMYGQVNCPNCGEACRAFSPEEAAEESLISFANERVLVLAPLDLAELTIQSAVLEELNRAGFTRVRMGGEVKRIEEFKGRLAERIDVVVDRLVAEDKEKTRFVEAVRTARSMAVGKSLLVGLESGREVSVNQHLTCVGCGAAHRDLSREDFLALVEGEDERSALIALAAKSAAELGQMPLEELSNFLGALEIGKEFIGGIETKLSEVEELGLQYLELRRAIQDLSSGERARLTLAHCLTNGLVGILYLFDAPLGDLHTDDVDVYINGLRRLVDLGNTVAVLDHGEKIIEAADTVYQFEGGRVREGKRFLPPAKPGVRRSKNTRGSLRVQIGEGGLLQEGQLVLPLNSLVCFSGVSGSGKSNILKAIVAQLRRVGKGRVESAVKVEIDGRRDIRRVVELPGEIRGKTAMVELGLADQVAQLFAATPAAQKRGYARDIFGLDKAGGRCITCEGRGVLQYDMQFLEDMSITCPTCEGKRYQSEVLEVTHRGMNIGAVLEMTCGRAIDYFARQNKIVQRLQAALVCGLENCRLGTDCRQLEPLELLYLKLAVELTRIGEWDLLVLDHPARGAHPEDVAILINALNELVKRGASALVAEHQKQVLEAADWLVEMGPGAGPQGGRVVRSEIR